MREILSFIFGKLTDPLGLPLVWYKEWLILAVIGFAAYIITYKAVGELYSDGWIDGSTAGSILHWVIRFIFFVVIWAITYAVIWLTKIIFAHWVIVVGILGGLLVVGAITYILIYHCKGN